MSIYDKQCMFRASFYPREAKIYTDIVRASVTNSMSALGPVGKKSKESNLLLFKVT